MKRFILLICNIVCPALAIAGSESAIHDPQKNAASAVIFTDKQQRSNFSSSPDPPNQGLLPSVSLVDAAPPVAGVPAASAPPITPVQLIKLLGPLASADPAATVQLIQILQKLVSTDPASAVRLFQLLESLAATDPAALNQLVQLLQAIAAISPDAPLQLVQLIESFQTLPAASVVQKTPAPSVSVVIPFPVLPVAPVAPFAPEVKATRVDAAYGQDPFRLTQEGSVFPIASFWTAPKKQIAPSKSAKQENSKEQSFFLPKPKVDPLITENAPNPDTARNSTEQEEVPASNETVEETAQEIVCTSKDGIDAEEEETCEAIPPAPCRQVCKRKCISYPYLPKRIDIRHVQGEGQGIGYGTNYSTVALLYASQYRPGHIMPMLDLRGHRSDNGAYAANIGIGGRYIPDSDCFCELLGFNVFWDYREGCLGHYNQIGVGIEVLGRCWDFRANAYAPIGKRKRKRETVFDDFTDGCFAVHRDIEFATYGFNAEVGYYLIKSSRCFFLYAAGGPYYLARTCSDYTLGGEVRLQPQYRDYITLDFMLSYDPVYHTVFQASIIFSLPLYQIRGRNCGPCGISDRQIYQPIRRFEIMPIGKTSCWEKNY